MKAPEKYHQQIDDLFDEAYSEGMSDGKEDGYDDGYAFGSRDAREARQLAEDARKEAVDATDMLAKLTDALGWDRLDLAKFRETGIMPPGKAGK